MAILQWLFGRSRMTVTFTPNPHIELHVMRACLNSLLQAFRDDADESRFSTTRRKASRCRMYVAFELKKEIPSDAISLQ